MREYLPQRHFLSYSEIYYHYLRICSSTGIVYIVLRCCTRNISNVDPPSVDICHWNVVFAGSILFAPADASMSLAGVGSANEISSSVVGEMSIRDGTRVSILTGSPPPELPAPPPSGLTSLLMHLLQQQYL